MVKESQAYRTIGEVSDIVGVPSHVLRFWEGKFSQVKPMKRRGGHRYYKQADIDILKTIQDLLHNKGFTVKGAKKFLAEGGSNDNATAPKTSNENVSLDKGSAVVNHANDNDLHKELLEIRKILTS